MSSVELDGASPLILHTPLLSLPRLPPFNMNLLCTAEQTTSRPQPKTILHQQLTSQPLLLERPLGGTSLYLVGLDPTEKMTTSDQVSLVIESSINLMTTSLFPQCASTPDLHHITINLKVYNNPSGAYIPTYKQVFFITLSEFLTCTL